MGRHQQELEAALAAQERDVRERNPVGDGFNTDTLRQMLLIESRLKAYARSRAEWLAYRLEVAEMQLAVLREQLAEERADEREPEPDLFDEPSDWAAARAEDLFIAGRDQAAYAREVA